MQPYSHLSLGPGGFHRLAYTEWGSSDNPHLVVCMHGLTRNGRDFDFLAGRLAASCRVLCPDAAGRGRSDWLPAPEQYAYPQYLADAAALIARATAPHTAAPETVRLDWVGTSMGGLIGLMLAAATGSPLRRLVLNDVGPQLPAAALNRLGTYVGRDPGFDTLAGFEAYLRAVHAPFGPLTAAQWQHLARHGHRVDRGRYRPAYDPAIGHAFAQPMREDVDLWALWQRVQIPVLVLRGAESDLLTSGTLARMQAEKPDLQVAEFDRVGHAPVLMDAAQTGVVEEFIRD